MTAHPQDFAHRTAKDVYYTFLDECVVPRVGEDREGPVPKGKVSGTKIDGRPVRLVTISGKGGWSADPGLAEGWSLSNNISLLDHLLSVARGALMFWLADALREWSGEGDMAEIKRRAYALVCIAFLHDIDKDLGLRRGDEIGVAAVAERMDRYGIDEFLRNRGIRISPAAMLNYIEEVEGTQAARSRAAPEYDRGIAAVCRYVELADKLEGAFAKRGEGVDGALSWLDRWPGLRNSAFKEWQKVEVHDHLHPFLLDRLQRALSNVCREVTGSLPLIEIAHDGRLLCLIPQGHARAVRERGLDRFLGDLPYGLRFAINNRLACGFVGGTASWEACRRVMEPRDWRGGGFVNLLALPRSFARDHRVEIERLFEAAGMAASWGSLEDSAVGATAKPALDDPGGDLCDLDMEPAHALAFLAIALNHTDKTGKTSAPNANCRESELVERLQAEGKEPPEFVAAVSVQGGRTRRVVLALRAVGVVWKLAEDDPDGAQELLNAIVGRDGLVGLWLEGGEGRTGLSQQIKDTSSDILESLRQRFSTYLNGSLVRRFDDDAAEKRCILCNEPVGAAWRVDTASRAHGVKVSAFSGRDGRNDHLAAPAGDTHLCPVCLAELQLRQDAQEEFRGSGDLPPLVSSPVATGLFGGMAFKGEDTDVSMGLHDLNRLEVKKGSVYQGLDCQTRRIRIARLETLPNKDKDLVTQLHMTLRAAGRLGRPIHIFRGAPRRHPAIFYSDSLPMWLERLLGGDSLRIEQIPSALAKLELFSALAGANGLGIEWAKQLADPVPTVRLGVLCVAWAHSAAQRDGGDRKHSWSRIGDQTREQALAIMKNTGGERVTLKNNNDPLVRLAWLASRIQRRRSSRDATNKQILCWKTALDFYPAAERSTTRDTAALILGLAGTLEENLLRGKNDAAARKYRDDQPLAQACIEFATHFAEEVWTKVFKSKEPASQEQRRAAAIYRFALLEVYRERGISEVEADAPIDRSRTS